MSLIYQLCVSIWGHSHLYPNSLHSLDESYKFNFSYFAFIHICCKQFFNCLKFNLVCLCVLFSFNNMLYQECSLGFWEQAYDTPRKLPTDEDQTGCWEQKWWRHIPVVLYSYFLLTCTNICNLSCSTSVLHILVWYLFFSFF